MNQFDLGKRFDEILLEVLESMKGVGGAVCRDPKKEAAVKLAVEISSVKVKEFANNIEQEDPHHYHYMGSDEILNDFLKSLIQ